MLTLKEYLKYLEHFSLITVGDDKIPNYAWKKQQSEKLSEDEFSKHFLQQTDKNYKNSKGEENTLKATKGVGIVTGFEDLEVLDVDLKVFSTTTEKTDFWEEFISLLKDSIFDFDEKFVIYKTKNAGYHLLYKSKRVGGNEKIASLQDHKEAIIETRGVGGYVFIYPENQISKKNYFDIQYISDDDRRSLMNIAKSYNYIAPIAETIEPKIKKQYPKGSVPPWEDFNLKNTVWDVVSDDFTVYRDTTKKTFIKRIGATSTHSGYIYKSDNLMFLHSTGTIYPAEKQISPYAAYTWKYHNGNYSASAKDLYEQGFGDRFKIEPIITADNEIKKYLQNRKEVEFPIDVFPKPFQNYIIECNEKLDAVIDYSSCALLWATSLMIGNTVKIKVKEGWYETPTLWLCIVGLAGAGKTPAMDRMIKPLMRENIKNVEEYSKKIKDYEEYSKMTKEEKAKVQEVKKPKKKQFIVDDITLEALIDLHNAVPSGVGVYKDEFSGWLKDMNKYRDGSDLEFWLSSWSGSTVIKNRVSGYDSFIKRPFIPVLGGIQPNIANSLYTDEKKDNGFLDRMLICFPENSYPKYNEEEISRDAIHWYNDTIVSIHRTLIKTFHDNFSEEKEIISTFTAEAKKLWIAKFNEITNVQNSHEEIGYFKSMYPKMKSYIPRFALILNVLNAAVESRTKWHVIDEEAMRGAIKLSDYFVANAKKLKASQLETKDFKDLTSKLTDRFEQVKAVYAYDNDFNRSKLADFLGVSRRTILNDLKNIQK